MNQVNFGSVHSVKVDAAHTVAGSAGAQPQCYIGARPVGSAVTITLPEILTGGLENSAPTAKVSVGQVVLVKDEAGSAGTYNITVDGAGSDTIDGSSSATISTNYGALRLIAVRPGVWMTF